MTVSMTCAAKACHVRFYLEDDLNSRLRESGETFYCVFGHSQSYEADNKRERELVDLRRRLELAESSRVTGNQWRDNQIRSLKGQLTRAKKLLPRARIEVKA